MIREPSGWGVWLALALCVGCPAHHHAIEPAAGSPEGIFEAARARAVPDPLRARFAIKLRSKPLDLAASTSGGLIVDRPGQGRVDLFGPMGGPVVTVGSDGAGLEVLLIGQQRDLVANDAESVLRETTGGVAGLDDVFAVLTGDLPFDAATVRDIAKIPAAEPGGTEWIRAHLDGPKGSIIEVVIDPSNAAPSAITALDKKGSPLITATYDPFQLVGDAWMPTRVELYVPALDLTVECKYKSWDVLGEPPTNLVPPPPDGFTVESLEEAVRKLAAATALKP